MSANRVPKKRNEDKYNHHYKRAAGMTQTTISIEASFLEEIKAAARAEDRSVSNFIVSELKKVLQKRISQ